MIPQRFEKANCVMHKPENMTEKECCDVHVYHDDKSVITCWKPTPEELVKINLGEPIWLWICGPTMPPVALTTNYSWDKPTIQDA